MLRRVGRLLAVLAVGATCAHAALPNAPVKSSGLLESLSSYEVVQVFSSTHALSGPPSTRHTEAVAAGSTRAPPVHPLDHEFSFASHGKEFNLQLRKSDSLFSPAYSESKQSWSGGQRNRRAEPAPLGLSRVEHCYYQGAAGTPAGINTCGGGFNGLIIAHGDSYIVEPAHEHLSSEQLHAHAMSIKSAAAASTEGRVRDVSPNSLHVVYKLSATHSFRSMAGRSGCGVADPDVAHSHDHTESVGDHSHAHQVHLESDQESRVLEDHFGVVHAESKADRKARKARFSTLSIPSQRYVELFVANDQMRYASLQTATEQRSAAIVNIMNTYYMQTAWTPSALQVILIGQTTFFTQDPWNISKGAGGGCTQAAPTEVCVDKFLSTWNEWRRNPDNTQPYDKNDAGHLFSGENFQASVLGYAGVGAMCNTAQSGGIEQMTSSSDTYNAAIGAHELGHNLGMSHDAQNADNTGCAPSGFIMNAIVGSDPPTTFSACSRSYYTTWTNLNSGDCLNNVPTMKYGDAVCGNGYVEAGEACDCGPYGVGIDSTTVNPNFCNTTANSCCDALSCQFLEGATCSNTDACCSNCQVASASENKVCRTASSSCDVAEVCDGIAAACPFDDTVGNGLRCTNPTYGSGACFEGRCMSYSRQCTEIGNVFPGGPFIPCAVQETLNENTGGYCSTLHCTTATARAGTCTYFDFGSGPEKMGEGIPCGDADDAGNAGTDSLCYKGGCALAETTNPRYQWTATDWEKCSDCNTIQARNISCTRTSNGAASREEFCTASARPPITQPCSDDELLCDHTIGKTVSLTLLGRTVTISSNIVFGVSSAIFIILLVIMQVCTACVARKDDDPLSVFGRKKKAAAGQEQQQQQQQQLQSGRRRVASHAN